MCVLGVDDLPCNAYLFAIAATLAVLWSRLPEVLEKGLVLLLPCGLGLGDLDETPPLAGREGLRGGSKSARRPSLAAASASTSRLSSGCTSDGSGERGHESGTLEMLSAYLLPTSDTDDASNIDSVPGTRERNPWVEMVEMISACLFSKLPKCCWCSWMARRCTSICCTIHDSSASGLKC